jgi:hypothetical protein
MIKRYFKSEKLEGTLIGVFGVIALLIAILLPSKFFTPFYKGLSFGLYIFSFVQIGFGLLTIIKAYRYEVKAKQYVASRPMDMIRFESSRIVNQVKYYKIVQLIFIILALFSAVTLFSKMDLAYFEGIASGVLIESITMITALLYSNKRADEYIRWMYHFYN